ncbi:hypothetical protein BH10ACT11_BH10ACT11_17100 [soil metagenome]
MLIKVFGGLSVVLLGAGVALVLTGSPLGGAIAILVAILVGSLLSAISFARGAYRSAREWIDLARGGASAVHVVSLEPPQGMIFNRGAVVELEVTGTDGTKKRVRREITVPIVQAISWKLAGKVPTPLGSLAEARELNVPLWRSKKSSGAESVDLADGSQLESGS